MVELTRESISQGQRRRAALDVDQADVDFRSHFPELNWDLADRVDKRWDTNIGEIRQNRSKGIWREDPHRPTPTQPWVMLADLVAGGGCIVEGSDAVNNPLSRLGKAVLDGGRQRDTAGPSSGMSPGPSQLPGPSSLLPSMGLEEEAFLEAFNKASLSDAWGQASSSSALFGPMHASSSSTPFGLMHHAPLPGCLSGAWNDAMQRDGALTAPAVAEAAWLDSQFAPTLSPVLEAKQAEAAQQVRGLMHRMMGDMSQTADLKAALQPLQLPPEVQAAAERRASNMCAHLRPVGSPHLWSARPAEASSVGAPANIDSFGEQAVLTPAYVAALDAQHDRLWQSLEQHTMPSLVEARQAPEAVSRIPPSACTIPYHPWNWRWVS